MKHHFGDLLDRDGNYWTIVPNAERHAYRIEDVPEGSPEVSIATIGKADDAWNVVLTLPNLEELTLHSPSREQVEAAARLTQLKRLRLSHALVKDVGFITSLQNLEELVFEYVSGFEDLSPISELPALRSAHFENLRKVHRFDGLGALGQLRYLAIDGTLDWKQPIDDFEFLRGLRSLEYLAFGQVINKTPFPALLPALTLKRLQRIRVSANMLAAEEYALLEVGLPGVVGADWGPFQKWEYSAGEEWFEFTGKGAGRAKCGHVQAGQKCDEYSRRYEAMKANARAVIK